MTKEKAVSLLSQMFLIQFSKEEHEALAMAIDALNADRKTENNSEKPNNFDKDINVRSKDERNGKTILFTTQDNSKLWCMDKQTWCSLATTSGYCSITACTKQRNNIKKEKEYGYNKD